MSKTAPSPPSPAGGKDRGAQGDRPPPEAVVGGWERSKKGVFVHGDKVGGKVDDFPPCCLSDLLFPFETYRPMELGE